MPEPYFLEKPSRKETQDLISEIKKRLESPEKRPRLTFLWPLNENRKIAFEMIKTRQIDHQKVINLLQSEDFIERLAGLYFWLKLRGSSEEFETIVKPAIEKMIEGGNKLIVEFSVNSVTRISNEQLLPLLTKLNKHRDFHIRAVVAESLGNLSEEWLKNLEEMKQDENWYVRLKVVQAFGQQCERAISEKKNDLVQQILENLDQMSKDEDSTVREKLAEILGNLDERVFPILRSMKKDENSFVRRQIVVAFDKLSKKDPSVLQDLEEMSNDKDESVREEVVEALANIGEKALDLLKRMRKDESPRVRATVAKVLGKKQNKEILSALEEMIQDQHFVVQIASAKSLVLLGETERGLKLLEELSKSDNRDIRELLAFSLSGLGKNVLDILGWSHHLEQFWKALNDKDLGEEGLAILRNMINDESETVRILVALALVKQGDKAKLILERMKKDKSIEVQRIVAQFLDREKTKKWLLASRKPLFATPYTEALIERISEIQKIVKQLSEQFPEDFIGLVILGSTHKGYMKPTSDLDWGIIAQKREVVEEFKKLAKESNLTLCAEHYIGVNSDGQIITAIKEEKAGENLKVEQILFQGLFFGDNNKLTLIQKNFLERIDSLGWDFIRTAILENEMNMIKAQTLFYLDNEELRELMIVSAILRTPPIYDETLKILNNKIEKKKSSKP